jgi:hypothetical protein
VQISLDLSCQSEPVVQDLGFAKLDEFSWVVLGEDTACQVEQAPPDAPLDEDSERCPADRDLIEIETRGGDVFQLRWDGEALETLFL